MDKAIDQQPGRGVRLSQLLAALGENVAHPPDVNVADPVVASVALLDADDVRLGVGRSTRTADAVLFVGVDGAAITEWLADAVRAETVPAAMLVKVPSKGIVQAWSRAGASVVELDPQARSERIYNVVSRVLDDAVIGDAGQTGRVEDLFTLAAEVARQTRGLVNIEDERAHLLAYSPADERADELRRLSILGREGPPEMMAWLRTWGVLDAVRTSTEVVAVQAHPDLGLAARLAMPIRGAGDGEFLGTIWLQRAGCDWARDVEQVLRGAAALAGRVIMRRRAAGSTHDDLVRRLLGAAGPDIDVDYLAAQFHLPVGAAMTVVGFAEVDSDDAVPPSAAAVSALTLRASALAPLSVTGVIGERVYVAVPAEGLADSDIESWARSAVAAAARLFDRRFRAVVGGPSGGLRSVAALRGQVDRVLDAAARGGGLIDDVTTVAASRTGVLLGEIVAHMSAHPDLVDSRVRAMVESDWHGGGQLAESLRAYLDRFGDVRKAAQDLNIHPNTLRYRIRRVNEVAGLDLDDPATRLVVALSLRATADRRSLSS